ncbi:MAG: GNAT family N-acetyltransferase [Lentisphaerae bacterium RIFOXYB12_FULL_65_16]|nr:MAG: GNAT family N-acetyltransferase [Lentisphaerae bacterium RIFOXYA12_64_32]OGV85917.1 MAG: GNAT family N-acetyltransferase [Lentisphaerae bacterium RIFOXYB12_FULL_65_16]
MRKSNHTIRTMTRQEVDIAIDWAAAEGWNPGLYDADCFYAADPSGFLVGLLGDEPIAAISAVKYGDSFGFLGFYIVKPAFRGKGYGIQIWNAALADLRGRTIGLDGVVDQQLNYKKSGFALAYGNIRHQGVGGGCHSTDPEIVPLSTIPFDKICAYDKPFFPDSRTQFLRCWIDRPKSVALGILRRRELGGYGVLRICRSGYKVGPLFADSPEFAERLFVALKAQAPEGAPVFLDTPAVNSAAIDLVKRHNMIAMFETARMYTGRSPDLPLSRLFGVTSFELG